MQRHSSRRSYVEITRRQIGICGKAYEIQRNADRCERLQPRAEVLSGSVWTSASARQRWKYGIDEPLVFTGIGLLRAIYEEERVITIKSKELNRDHPGIFTR